MARKKISSDNPAAYVGCTKCNTYYTITEGQLNRGEDSFTCQACGSDIIVIKYAYCPHCDSPVGFSFDKDNHSIVGEMVKSAVEGYTSPLSAIKKIGSLFDSHSDGYACVCPYCKKKVIICSQCGNVMKISKKPKINDLFTCDNCGEDLEALMDS